MRRTGRISTALYFSSRPPTVFTTVPRNDKDATALESRACDAGYRQACMALATMHKQGRTGTKDPAAATKEQAYHVADSSPYPRVVRNRVRSRPNERY